MLLDKTKMPMVFSVLSNVFVLVSTLLLGFFLPKYISMETYAQYRAYLLYANYVGLFHFGFINGIYLKYGKYDYSDLPRPKFSGYTRFLFIAQALVEVILFLLLYVIYGNDGIISPVFFVVMNIFLINVNCYFALVNQFTRRFSLDAIIQLLQMGLQLFGFVLLLIFKVDNYIIFLTVVTITNLIVLGLNCFKCKDILPVLSSSELLTFTEVKELISRGSKVMFSEYIALIVVGIDSILVNLFMSVEEFSLYAFSVSIVTGVFSLIGVIGKLVFPYLKRTEESKRGIIYDKMKYYITLFSSVICGMVLVIPIIIDSFIPDYSGGVLIIRILGGAAIFKGVQDLVCVNFFKAINYEKGFIKTNSIVIAIGLFSDVFALMVFSSMNAIASASVLTFLIWYLLSDHALKKKMNMRGCKSDGFVLATTVLFYACVFLKPVIGLIIYYPVLFVLALCFHKLYNTGTESDH